MLSTYYLLRGLAHEWSSLLSGSRIGDLYSQRPDELSILFEAEEPLTLRASFGGRLRFVYLEPTAARARRNVADVLAPARGHEVLGVRVADRDRVLHFDLAGGMRIDITLFGARANAFLTTPGEELAETFRGTGQTAPPAPRSVRNTDEIAAAFPETWSEFRAADHDGRRRTCAQFVRRAHPLMNSLLAEECVARSGLPKYVDEVASDALETAQSNLIAAIREVESEALDHRHAKIYTCDDRPMSISIVRLSHPTGWEAKEYDSISEAVRRFVKRSLSWAHFDREYVPVRSAVQKELDRNTKRLARLSSELQSQSRADRYEHWGHVLMATNPGVVDVPPGGRPGDTIVALIADPFDADASSIEIPIQPRLSLVENAQRYYEKSKATRAARASAMGRLEEMTNRVMRLERLIERLDQVAYPQAWRDAKKKLSRELAPYAKRTGERAESVPYRRFVLDSGFEVWVGRNAKQNDELTTRAARKFDLWMHARGAAGSHAVLRLPSRDAQVPEDVVLTAAGIAAYYSKARGADMAPVIVAERKFVRKPRRAPAGTVLVDRHRVVLVTPGLPSRTKDISN